MDDNQIERIAHMERQLERASQAVKHLAESIDEYKAALKALHELETYFSSSDWKQDFADDEAGLLPKCLKRGVLSEDGLWNLLEEWNDVKSRIEALK